MFFFDLLLSILHIKFHDLKLIMFILVDWICVNMLTAQPGVMGRIRYMHKDELKYIPLFGLYFWQVRFI